MSEYEDEVRSPTGLERLAGLLAATKEDAAAEISKLNSQVEALEVERRTLEAALETCRDELGDAKSLVEQLRLENTRKWRVEERDDWRALLHSMQTDRTALQHQNDMLETDLKRCIAGLLHVFPDSFSSALSPRAEVGEMVTAADRARTALATEGAAGVGVEARPGAESAGNIRKEEEDADHPPELTQRRVRARPSSVNDRALAAAAAAVDLEWLSSLAREFGVMRREVVSEDAEDGGGGGDGGNGNKEGERSDEGAWGGCRATGSGSGSSRVGGGDLASECLRLRVELDALKLESDAARVALESQVFEQQQELRKLRLEVSRSDGARGGTEGAAAERGVMLAGMFRWWKQDRTQTAAAAAHGKKWVTGGGGGARGRPLTGAVTVV